MVEMKKFSKLITVLGSAALLAACGNSASDSGDSEADAGGASGAPEGLIQVISREEGSGTRDAFVEITGVKEGDNDNTTDMADIQNSTDGVMTSVAGDPAAIGYISLGSLNDTVKALNVNGVEPTEENVASGEYAIARPFNIVHKGDLEGAAQDFHDFIFSKEGQDIILAEGYVPVKSDAEAYAGDGSAEGNINISGSTSVGPVMEKLKEEYEKLNPGVSINITQNGSGAGVQAAQEGTADIGMASRELKEDETDVEAEAIAQDGIAVIVNNENGLGDITLESVKGIFVGEITDWSEVK
ncbi:substrate-binding domain-containing protein [Aerococcus sanguinicola]|uniref:Phosphate ABC transporter substrate-binding protein n=2 Tax=Aerococcus sanguinicola TaxID=119206 RepID=A0A0X8FBH6_9LACT|nr:substrate-binding domain-containing protein [Aerococcus sanguinicola]AMB94289.1 phosphate ABC transporter substrate-binding protein [Aerococcus sanguinicola]MDK7049931.1 extracellular solute-binding protein [Aerococcus sanguinicola]OFT92621.1 phosphate ABC transporter substrate-binding protein [Aerococcus sp. HMSC23C02]